MHVTLTFLDRKFHHEHDYTYMCDLPLIPRVGERVSLPILDESGEIRHGNTLWTADWATVESVTWFLPEDSEPCSILVYCRIEWRK